MDFSLFLLALYLLWDNFLISEMTSIHMNNTTLPQLHDFWLRTRCKWDMRFLGGFYAASIDSFLPTFRDNSRWWWNSHSGVDEDSSHLGHFALPTGQFTCIFGASSPRCHIFLFLPPILDSTEAGTFLFCDFTVLSQRKEKVCTIFICSCFWGSLQCFWCTGTCYECSNCLYHREAKFELCFVYFFV